MSLAKDENVVAQLAPKCADEAFGERVHVRRTDRGAQDARVHCGQGTRKARAELRVAVADQYLRGLSIESCVARLLRAPAVGGRVGTMPAEDRRGLNEQQSRAPCGCDASGDAHGETLPRFPPHASVDLALSSDQLLPEQSVFGQKCVTATDEVSDQTEGEPQEVDHPDAIARPTRRRNL